MSKALVKSLPEDRPFSEVEAMFSLSVSYDCGQNVSVSGMATRWGWTRRRVSSFLERVGVNLAYSGPPNSPLTTAQVVIQLADNLRTSSGQVTIIDSKGLRPAADNLRTSSGQVANNSLLTIKDPKNLNPKPEKKTDLGDKPPVIASSKIDCLSVFDHWKTTLSHPRAKLDQKREKLIRARLKDGYTVENLCDAISGCQLSPWHMGENKDNQIFDDLGLILRDGAHVDQFLKVKENPPNRNLSPQGRQAVDDSARWLEMHEAREARKADEK